jgi:hypothetical protein
MRQYEIHLTTQGGNAQKSTQDKKDACRNNPEGRGDCNISEHLAAVSSATFS